MKSMFKEVVSTTLGKADEGVRRAGVNFVGTRTQHFKEEREIQGTAMLRDGVAHKQRNLPPDRVVAL